MVKIQPPSGGGLPFNNKGAYLPPEYDVRKHPGNGRENLPQNSRKNPESNPDFATIRIVSKAVLFILKKCWMVCGVSFVTIFIVYWYCSSVVALLFLLFSITGLLYQIGDWLLYHPDQPPHSRLYVPSPSMFGLTCDNIHLKTKDKITIHAMLIKQESSIFSQVPTMIYFHGNAGNIGHRLPNVQGLFYRCGCNILLVEYRGYGHSEGTPSEEGLYLDAQAAIEYLLQHPGIDHSKIIVFGRSLGGAIAIDLASHPEYSRCILGVVTENTFTSIPEMARVLFTWRILQWLPDFCSKNQYRSIDKVGKVTTPILFICGLSDALIPPSMTQSLYQKCSSSMKRVVTFESGTHNETWQCNGYYNTLNLFFDDIIVANQEKQSVTWQDQEKCVRIPAEII